MIIRCRACDVTWEANPAQWECWACGRDIRDVIRNYSEDRGRV